MVSKVLDSNKSVYDNSGSSAKIVNYLQHEETERQEKLGIPKRQDIFYNSESENISAQEVQDRIDNNKKGLKLEDSKFHSLLISPSQDELKHIGNNPEKLKAYTKDVMENYAKNYALPKGKTLEEKDLIWYAVIHTHRRAKGTDDKVKAGEIKQGEKKEGLQTHIHITVSARDKAMKTTLHPNTDSKRFNYSTWIKANVESFDKRFVYDRSVKQMQSPEATSLTAQPKQQNQDLRESHIRPEQREAISAKKSTREYEAAKPEKKVEDPHKPDISSTSEAKLKWYASELQRYGWSRADERILKEAGEKQEYNKNFWSNVAALRHDLKNAKTGEERSLISYSAWERINKSTQDKYKDSREIADIRLEERLKRLNETSKTYIPIKKIVHIAWDKEHSKTFYNHLKDYEKRIRENRPPEKLEEVFKLTKIERQKINDAKINKRLDSLDNIYRTDAETRAVIRTHGKSLEYNSKFQAQIKEYERQIKAGESPIKAVSIFNNDWPKKITEGHSPKLEEKVKGMQAQAKQEAGKEQQGKKNETVLLHSSSKQVEQKVHETLGRRTEPQKASQANNQKHSNTNTYRNEKQGGGGVFTAKNEKLNKLEPLNISSAKNLILGIVNRGLSNETDSGSMQQRSRPAFKRKKRNRGMGM